MRASTAPGSGATAAPGSGATATPNPGGSTAPVPGSVPAPTPPPDAPGVTNVVPPIPASGQCRAGQTYSISVTSGPTDITPAGSVEGFTIFEPSTICAGHTYPLVLNGPGFGGDRTSAAGSFPQFTTNGYGVMSMDEAGEGGDGGKIRVMDPDQEGVMLLAAMNWAQAKLAWLAYGPTNDGADPHEPIMGSDGGSYGGMYQFMLVNIDKRHRIRAMAPDITPHDLNYALFPGGVIKSDWDLLLTGDGNANGFENGHPLNFDQFVTNSFVTDLAQDAEDPNFHDFMAYHSADYFCNGTSVATNGGAGTAPWLPPATAPPKINALISIGVRDTLFDFNNGYLNYKCLQQGGGDVRLISHQSGHNSGSGPNDWVSLVPDPYLPYYPADDSTDNRCGKLAQPTAELAFFNQYLKGQAGAASIVPTGPCISFELGDGITMPQLPTYTSGPAETPFSVGSVSLVSGGSPDELPTAVTLLTAPAAGLVVAGIPHIVMDVAPTLGVSYGTPIIYVGYGVKHASNPTLWDLVDNQVQPLRGIGHYDEDITGGGVRLLPGDQLGILFFGENTQFATNGSVSAPTPTVEPLTVTGTMYLPVMPNIAANI